jgi:hypothetical protein
MAKQLLDSIGSIRPFILARANLMNGQLAKARTILKTHDSALHPFREVHYLSLFDAIEAGGDLDLADFKPTRKALLKTMAIEFYYNVFLFNHLDREADAIRQAMDR